MSNFCIPKGLLYGLEGNFNSDISVHPQGLTSSLSSEIITALRLTLSFPTGSATHRGHRGPHSGTYRELDYRRIWLFGRLMIWGSLKIVETPGRQFWLFKLLMIWGSLKIGETPGADFGFLAF